VSQPIPFNLCDPLYTSDLYAFFAPLREAAPVQSATLADGQVVWLLTRYADVEAALTDARLVKDPRNARSPEGLARMPAHSEAMRYLSHQILSRDPPDQVVQQTAAEILASREITALSAAGSTAHCRSAPGRSTFAGVQKVEIRQGEKEGA
jgi:cytochrome P450